MPGCMVNRHDTSEPRPRTVRFASLVAFLATVAVLAALGMARSAQALTPPAAIGARDGVALLPPDEPEAEAESVAEGEEGESGECETGELSEAEAEEEGEVEEEECGGSGPGLAPPQCLLTSAVATVSASKSDKVRLAIRYTAVSPVTVEIDYWLRGSKGPLTMAGEKEHFGTSGVYRETAKLTDSQMTKVRAAKSFTIRLRPQGAPSYCRPFQDSHLTTKHADHGELTWLDPETSYRSHHKR